MRVSPDGKRGCYTWKGAFIPMCWGSVNHGPRGCYCKVVHETDEVNLAVMMTRKLDLVQDELIGFRKALKQMRKSLRGKRAKESSCKAP